jgi:hypothetical protein
MVTILQLIKDILGGVCGESEFDPELLMFINSGITILSTFGVQEFSGLFIDDNTVWPVFSDVALGSLCKAYLGTKVRVQFDPPANTAVLSAYGENLYELECRIQILINEAEAAEV